MDEALIRRVMPHSVEAEQAVIASMLMDKDAVVVATDMLVKDDFYVGQYGILFEAMAELYREGKPTDLVQVQERVRRLTESEEVAGMEVLRDILSAVPTSANIKHYAELVKDKSTLRKMIKTSQAIEEECFRQESGADAILFDAEKSVLAITQSGGKADFTPVSDITLEALERMQAAAKSGGKITGIATGFNDLDYKTAGLQNSNLIIVAARPAMGKTAFILNIAHHVAVKHDIPTAIFRDRKSVV